MVQVNFADLVDKSSYDNGVHNFLFHLTETFRCFGQYGKNNLPNLRIERKQHEL